MLFVSWTPLYVGLGRFLAVFLRNGGETVQAACLPVTFPHDAAELLHSDPPVRRKEADGVEVVAAVTR